MLITLGLSEREARVYSVLLIKGEKNVGEIAKLTGIPQPHVYSLLKSVKGKGVVSIRQEETKKYQAVPFDQAIDKLIFEKEKALISLKHKSHEFAQKIKIDEKGMHLGEIQPIFGKENIAKKAIEMAQGANSEIISIISVLTLMNDKEFLPFFIGGNRRISMRTLTNLDAENIKNISPLFTHGKIRFLPQKSASKMLIIDQQALLELSFNDLDEPWNVAIWTDHGEIVKVARQRFEEIWKNSKDLQSINPG